MRPSILPILLFGIVMLAGTVSDASPDVLAAWEYGDDLGRDAIALEIATDGTLLLLDRFGDRASLTRLHPVGVPMQRRAVPGRARDLAVDRRTGDLAVLTDSELRMLNPSFESLWVRPLSMEGGEPGLRITVGEAGTVAAITAHGLFVFTGAGVPLGAASIGGELRDVAVVDSAGLIVVAGSREQMVCDRPLQVATLAGFDLAGAPRWSAYGGDERGDRCDDGDFTLADTRGVAVSRGEDGHVYFLAEVEGENNPFHNRPGHPEVPAANVVFDRYSEPEATEAAVFSYHARFAPDGAHLLGQYFTLPDAGAIVRPRSIAADVHGNVFVAGSASHSLGAADERALTARLDATAGYFQVLEPDFEARRVFHTIDADDMTSELIDLAIDDGRALALLHAHMLPGRPAPGGLPAGPSLLVWPAAFGPLEAEKRPDPETQGTFGYESGVSGSDPTCYCDSSRAPSSGSLLVLATLGLASLSRPRRRR